MSLIKKELTEKSGFTMEFSVSKEAYDKAENDAYKKKVKTIVVPGFRKGKAPKSIIEKMYGKGFFFDDAINACLPEAFEAAVKEAGITVVGMPTFGLVSAEGDIVLKAEGFVKPEVTIEGYKGIEVEKKVAEVTDAEVEAEITKVRERNARTVEITDRAAAMGDITNINFEGFVDGVAFAGGKSDNHDLKLGSGQFIPGFEDQIVGKTIGEEFDVNVTFPEEYHSDELAGKAAVFKVKLNAIKFEELPEADDEFAKDVSEFDTLDEYKADIKAKMVERNEKQADNAVDNTLSETLMEKLVAEIPEVMFEEEVEKDMRDFEARLKQNNITMDLYFAYTGLTLETLKEQMHTQAVSKIKLRLALEKIAELEAVTVTDEEADAEFEKIASAYSIDVAEVKKMIAIEDIKADVAASKAMIIVKESAVIKA